jgi:signal transduction histidine kinase
MASQPLSLDNFLYGFGELAKGVPVEQRIDSENTWAVGLICESLKAQLGCFLSLSRDKTALLSQQSWQGGTVTQAAGIYALDSAPSQSIVLEVLKRRRCRAIDEANSTDPFLRAILAALQSPPLGASVIAPVVNSDEFVGVLLVGRLKGEPQFTSSELLLFESLASVLSLHHENLSLRQDVESLAARVSCVGAQLLQSAKLAATGKLAASIAHEINNPLQSVQSCIFLVADGLPEEGSNRQYLEIAREELDRIAKIVQRLADLYRPSQEGRKPTDINGLLENVLALMGKRLQQNDVEVAEFFAPNLPLIIAAADQIKQVYFNLILNAMEAMPDGGHLEVITRLVQEAQQSSVEVVFKDTGVGIASESIERMFDPFFTTKAKGTGLGLSISHDIIEGHGGSIRVESQLGIGSTFRVCLPVTDAGARE